MKFLRDFLSFWFAGCLPLYFSGRGGDANSNTQSTSTSTQTDARVGAADQGIAVGSGGTLDQSFNDLSTVELNVADNSTHSESNVYNVQTLDAELARSALGANVAAIDIAGGVLAKQIDASNSAAAKNADALTSTLAASLAAQTRSAEIAAELVGKALDMSKSAAEVARAQQSEFLAQFTAAKQTDGAQTDNTAIKSAAAVAIVAALAWAATR